MLSTVCKAGIIFKKSEEINLKIVVKRKVHKYVSKQYPLRLNRLAEFSFFTDDLHKQQWLTLRCRSWSKVAINHTLFDIDMSLMHAKWSLSIVTLLSNE